MKISIWQRHQRPLKFMIWLGGIFAAWIVLGVFAVPPIAKTFATRNLATLLDREVSIDTISFNPLTLVATVRGVSVRQRDTASDLAAFRELVLDLEWFASILARGIVLRELQLDGLRFDAIRYADRSYNFSDLLAKFAARDRSHNTTAIPRFSLNNIQITDASIRFEDLSSGERQIADEVQVTVPFVSNLPAAVDIFVEPKIQARVNGTRLALNGKTKPFKRTRETSLDIALEQLDLTRFLTYLPLEVPLQIQSANLAAHLNLAFKRNPDGPDQLVLSGPAQLHGLAARDRAGAPLISANRVDFEIERIEPIARIVKLKSVAADAVEARLHRDSGGKITIANLKPQTPPANQAAFDGVHNLQVSVAQLRVSNSKLRFSDDSLPAPFNVTLQNIEAVATGIDSTAKTPIAAKLTARSNLDEQVDLRADVVLSPLTLRGEITVSGVQARQYAAYYERYVRFRTLNGKVDARATYDLTVSEHKLKGRIDVTDLTLREGKISANDSTEPFAGLAHARLHGPTIDFDRRRVRFASIRAETGDLLIRRDADGHINLATHFTREKPKQIRTNDTKRRQPWVVEFGEITVNGHTVRFEDIGAPQRVKMIATSISGKAMNLSTERNHSGEVEGRFEIESGSVQGKGSMTLRRFATNLALQVQNVDVIPALPYVADRIKVTIASGRASLDGRLHLEHTEQGVSGA
ncbi:MAG: DUF748 domain-containing protein, partial [Burkholderiales bacterium]